MLGEAVRPGRPGIRLLRPFETFFALESASGILLIAAAVVAIIWANSPWSGGYSHLWETPVGFSAGGTGLTKTLHHWINDGLMAVFFFVVGLELKREVLTGELASFRKAALSIAAALGGMAVPAAIYAALNGSGVGAPGWGIPMATDIAFALGVLALLGNRVPVSLKVFVTAVAIVDDMGAVLVIAIFYTEKVNLLALAAALGSLVLLYLATRLSVRRFGTYLLLAGGVWAAMLASGVHATVAGILVALTVPVRSGIEPGTFLATLRGRLDRLERGPLTRESTVREPEKMQAIEEIGIATLDFLPNGFAIERYMHPFTAFFVLPVFALFNAGVRLDGHVGEVLLQPVSVGIVLGLFLGKQVGITLVSWLAVKSGHADLPPGVTLAQIHGASILGGIGFTMSIFVAGLAFPEGKLLAAAKLGILAASAISGVIGFVVLKLVLARAPVPRQP